MSPQVYSNVGKYDRRNLLDKGHFGAVFEAHDRALHAPRALKVIETRDPNNLFAKLREARLLEICRHKHVVEVKEADIAMVDGKRCVIIATELVSEGSAQSLVEREFVPLSRSIQIIREALFGLEHLHDNGVVHCDIKPGNILLAEEGAKLSDFGLAVTLQSGQLPGGIYTLHMAPESTNGVLGTKSCDIYAMGVTLYRLVNNIKDLGQIAPQSPQNAIKRGKFPDRKAYHPYVPPKIKRIVNKAMCVDPSRRYQSAFKFRQALEGVKINIDWNCLSPDLWEGKQNGDLYKLTLLVKPRSWCVEFTKNGRRQTRFCQSGFNNNWDAESFIYKLIAQTSLL